MQNKEAKPINEVVPFYIYVQVQEKNNLPAIELRRLTCEKEIVKAIISAAFREVPIIVMPVFNNKVRSIGSLIEKNLIYKEGSEFYFNF
jgi:hypothetical protein